MHAATPVLGSRRQGRGRKRSRKARLLLADAEGAFATIGDEPHKPSVERRLSVLTNVAAISFLRADLARLMGDADAAVAADETALGYLGEHDWLLSSHVRWNLGVAEWLRGDLERAERSLAGVFAERRTAGEGYLAMRVAYDLGHVQRARGRLGAALDTYQLGLMTCSEGGRELPAAGMAHVGLAQVLYERGSWTLPSITPSGVSHSADIWRSRSRGPRAWPPSLGSVRRRAIPRAPWTRWRRPNASG